MLAGGRFDAVMVQTRRVNWGKEQILSREEGEEECCRARGLAVEASSQC